MLKINTKPMGQSTIYARMDDMFAANDGLLHFDQDDVFVVDGKTRVLVNSLPEIVNIIEHFSFEFAKARTEEINLPGFSTLTPESQYDVMLDDAAVLTRGKEREIWRAIVARICHRVQADESTNSHRKTGVLRRIDATISKVMTTRIETRDCLVTSMVDQGVFETENGCTMANLECGIANAVGDYLFDNAPRDDLQQFTELLRNLLGF